VRPAATGPDRSRRRAIERTRRRRARVRLGLLVLLALGLLAAAFAIGRTTGGSGGDAPVVVDCVQRATTIAKWPSPGWQKDAIIDGPVTFVGARDAARQQPKDGHVTAELPVLVDAEKQVTIRAGDGVTLGFGDDPAQTSAITLKACPRFEKEVGARKSVGRFTQFTGDFRADEPTCADLELDVLGEPDPRHVKLGIGKSCD